MSNYDLEVEKYEVYYLENGKKVKSQFYEAERAIEFAREKMDKGIDVDIKQINVLVGWY